MITYRLAEKEDFEEFYRIKCDRLNIEYSGFTECPNRDHLSKWFSEQLHSHYRKIYLVLDSQIVCAFFYLDKINDITYEFSASGVLSQYRGKGIGAYTVEASLDIAASLGATSCISLISEENIASYKRFMNAGFVRTDEYEMRNLPLLGGLHKFYKWIKEI